MILPNKDLKEKTSVKKVSNQKSIQELVILPESSFLIAIIDKEDSHHVAASSSLGALLPYQPSCYVPVIVFMEVISYLIRIKKMSVSKAQGKLLRLLGGELHAKGAKGVFDVRDILKKYKIYSRIKIRSLTSADFHIVTEGIGRGAKILTCDLKMYKAVKKYYNDIYFITDKVERQESDLSRLIKNIQLHKRT